MSEPGFCEKWHDVFANMSSEKIDLWAAALSRAVEVEAEAEAELAKNRISTEHLPEKSESESESEKNIEYAIKILEQMKHTPSSHGGSRKRSINCRRPRGFSQRQHCKYGRRPTTTTRRRIKSKYARD
jgi:hypothetical protein